MIGAAIILESIPRFIEKDPMQLHPPSPTWMRREYNMWGFTLELTINLDKDIPWFHYPKWIEFKDPRKELFSVYMAYTQQVAQILPFNSSKDI